MERLALEVDTREESGKGAARRLRARGLVPAVAYGYGLEPLNVQVGIRSLEKAMETGANALLDLSGDAALKGKLFLVKETQRDPATRGLLHCDFFSVDTSHTIHVAVPLRLEGKPVGVEMGGVLEPLMREVEVSCLPLAIPDAIQLDVSSLEIGDALHVRDLTVPEGVELLADESVNVVHVIAPKIEEEPTEEAEALEGAVEAAAPGEKAPSEGEAPPDEKQAAKGEGD